VKLPEKKVCFYLEVSLGEKAILTLGGRHSAAPEQF
jgi:hypothetical protein